MTLYVMCDSPSGAEDRLGDLLEHVDVEALDTVSSAGCGRRTATCRRRRRRSACRGHGWPPSSTRRATGRATAAGPAARRTGSASSAACSRGALRSSGRRRHRSMAVPRLRSHRAAEPSPSNRRSRTEHDGESNAAATTMAHRYSFSRWPYPRAASSGNHQAGDEHDVAQRAQRGRCVVETLRCARRPAWRRSVRRSDRSRRTRPRR